jgi:hypothetical protein
VKASIVTTKARAPGGQFVLHARDSRLMRPKTPRFGLR